MREKLLLFAMVCGLLSGNEEKPKPIGNFSVPTVSQLAPLIGFGQLLIGENAMLPQFSGRYAKLDPGSKNIMMPTLIYGIRDDLDIAVFVPFTPREQSGAHHSAGFLDMILQGEYGYYTASAIDHTLQGTIVANVQFPTGSDSKNPRTGNGSCTYFLGTTFAYLSYNWYAFASTGANLTTAHHGTKFGNSYLYQWGFARYIAQLSPKGWVFDLMVEFDGAYAEKDKLHGKANQNSGGSLLVITPSIWASSKRVVLQWGMSFPIVQNPNGNQAKVEYSIGYNLGVAFQF